MKTRMLRASTVVLLSLIAWGAAAADIVIGQAAPLSGTLASTGEEMVLGARIYFDAINAQGGVAGVTDFDQYAVTPGAELAPDFFL